MFFPSNRHCLKNAEGVFQQPVGACEVPLNKPRRFLRICFSMLTFACTFAQAQSSENEFQRFLSRFKAAVRANDTAKIADLMNFPFYVHSFPHSRVEFLNN